MSSKRKKIIAGAVVVIAIMGLLVIVLRGSPANYWVTPAELQSQGVVAGQPVRVAGKIVNRTLNWDQANNQMIFKIRAEGEKAVLPVVYPGIAPESLVGDSQVIVEGSIEAGKLKAQTVLVRCPDNYLSEKAVGALFRGLKIEGALFR
ncbi:MAG: cytochrome c maturation protein CcmE [Actinomycetota bacterium]|nr:cytochrome c maturation protein CcmE [Actinomycetota bacterium]